MNGWHAQLPAYLDASHKKPRIINYMASRPTTRSGRCYAHRTRDRLQANRIAERLVAFVLGENDRVTKKPVTMTASQVRAAQIVLDKVLPDLRPVDLKEPISERPLDELTDRELTDLIAETRAELNSISEQKANSHA